MPGPNPTQKSNSSPSKCLGVVRIVLSETGYGQSPDPSIMDNHPAKMLRSNSLLRSICLVLDYSGSHTQVVPMHGEFHSLERLELSGTQASISNIRALDLLVLVLFVFSWTRIHVGYRWDTVNHGRGTLQSERRCGFECTTSNLCIYHYKKHCVG
jgi:hypothetical protein